MKNIIYIKAWRGELSFAKAFWIVQFLTTLAMLIFVEFLFNNDLGFIVQALYTIYALICVWRCRRKYRLESMSKDIDANIFYALTWSVICVILTVYTAYEVLST